MTHIMHVIEINVNNYFQCSKNHVVIKRYCHRSYQGKLSQKEIPIEYDSYTKKEGEGS